MSPLVTGQLSSIQRFYSDKVVLLTGGTGFLGKILIEKLLRSCSDIACIYLLVREKNGIAAEDRLQNLINDSAFYRLRKEQPRFSDKLTLVQGNLLKPRLGLSQSSEALLKQRVDVVLHSAATVNFNERLKLAIETNVSATKQLCGLAQQFVNLKAFVYVSTAYSNCDQELIPERVCPPPITPEKLIGLTELLDENELDKITPNLLHPKPNTYIFSKSAAENVVNNYRASLPVAILRPSIVVPTATEPTPGWVDNHQGSSGTVAAVSAGLMRTIMCNNEAQANMVPVDKVANGAIALAYTVASENWKCSKEDKCVPIINFVAKSYNCMTWGSFRDYVNRFTYQYPSQHLLWYPFYISPEHRWTARVSYKVLHHIPAMVIDAITGMCGKPTKLRRFYQNLDKYMEAVTYFSTRQFNFEEDNSDRLWSVLEPEDKKLFPLNMADMDWTEFMRNYVVGCRRYLLKEDDSTLEKSRFKVKVLYCVHFITKASCLLIALTGSGLLLKNLF